jgi:hypothetical protein
MGYSLCLIKFTAGRKSSIPLDDISRILTRHGCKIPQLQEGNNEIILPHDEKYYSPIGGPATLSIEGNSVSEFGIDRPQYTTECKALLYSLLDELGLTMFPDFGRVMFARKDVFQNVPKSILDQFSEHIVVTGPDDCFC